MIPVISSNTQAILLLTAPLIVGRGSSSPDILTPGEYKRLARHLREIQHEPADLFSQDATELLRACNPVIDETRLQRLLGRGFQLSQAIERWQTRAIWVVSRADAEYPKRLKVRLREDAPAVLYGCGDHNLMESGGLAVVGSRHVDDTLIEFTMAVGRLAAKARRNIVSGGARGIDQAAMRGALEDGGKVIGVLAENLEKTSMKRENRNFLLDGQLVLLTPYDPSAGFNVGNAMQRNKLIYALADAALVVNSDLKKGGTWAGAVEQIDKLRLVPVYVRLTSEPSPGLDALRKKGALPWPDPKDVDALEAVFEVTPEIAPSLAKNMDFLFPDNSVQESTVTQLGMTDNKSINYIANGSTSPVLKVSENSLSMIQGRYGNLDNVNVSEQRKFNPADALFSVVREIILQLLKKPMKEANIAAALDVSKAQTKIWLQRLVDEDRLIKLQKPVRYVVKQRDLFQKVIQNNDHGKDI
jgi:DNA processing protein